MAAKSNAEKQRQYRERKKAREGESYLEKENMRVKQYYIPSRLLTRRELEVRQRKAREEYRKRKRTKDVESNPNSTQFNNPQPMPMPKKVRRRRKLRKTSTSSGLLKVKLPFLRQPTGRASAAAARRYQMQMKISALLDDKGNLVKLLDEAKEETRTVENQLQEARKEGRRLKKQLQELLQRKERALASGAGTDTWDPHYISCDGFPDGYHEYGCWGKAVCVNGQPVVTKCADGQMFDQATDSCVSASQTLASTACNTMVDCSKATTGRHADLGDGCKSYFICMEGAFMGRMYCPRHTIFNEALQICDYLGDVAPPCGTFHGHYASTPNGPWPEYTAVPLTG